MATYQNKAHDYYLSMNKKCPVLARHGRNLNLCCLENKLDPCYHRESIIDTMQKILLRKNKANILLTGVAGCGKTALVEGLAAVITMRKLLNLQAYLVAQREYKRAMDSWEKSGQTGDSPMQPTLTESHLSECVIYELSLNSLVSGTKYRGEFEEKVEDILQECKKNPNVILFVDEVHHIDRVGASEGCVSASQILKPALARNEIRMIGATTTTESTDLLKDQAFARRFSAIEVPALTGEAALDIARHILQYYSTYHNVSTDVSADNLLMQVRFHLPDTVFPDNFINLVDETFAGAVFDGLSKVGAERFYQTLSRLSGRLIICADEASALQAS